MPPSTAPRNTTPAPVGRGQHPPTTRPERVDMSSVMGKIQVIFDAFMAGGSRLSLADIVRLTSLPKTTVHRICQVLTGAGMLEQVSGGYRLGMRLFELGQRVPRQRILRDAARPAMQELLYQSKAIVHLAVLDGLDALVIERLSPYRLPTRHAPIAGRMPLHCTAAGKALLAFSPPELVTEVLREGLPRRTPHTITSALHFTNSLERARRDGIATEVEEMHVGFLSAGAPILNADMTPAAAISATTTLHDTRMEHLSELVRSAATATQAALRGC